MKPTPLSKQLVTFQLDWIVHDLLHDLDEVPVSEHTAEMLHAVTKNKHTCHIQNPGHGEVDIMGKLISQPHLWNINAWQSSSEKWQRARLYSKKEMDIHMIRDANVKLIAKRLCRELGLDYDMAQNAAVMMLVKKKFNNIKAFGVSKLIEKVEEI